MYVYTPSAFSIEWAVLCALYTLASCPSILHGGSLWGPFSLLLYVDLGLDCSVGEHQLVSSRCCTVALRSCHLMLLSVCFGDRVLEVWSYWNKGYVGICTKYG